MSLPGALPASPRRVQTAAIFFRLTGGAESSGTKKSGARSTRRIDPVAVEVAHAVLEQERVVDQEIAGEGLARP